MKKLIEFFWKHSIEITLITIFICGLIVIATGGLP